MKTTTSLIAKTAGMALAVLVAGDTARAGSQIGAGDNLTAQEIAGKSRAAYAALSSYRDNGTVVSEIAGHKSTLTFHTRLQRPNLYRIDWTQGGTVFKGTIWSDGSGDYLQTTAPGPEDYTNGRKMPNMKKTLAQAAAPSWMAASAVPGVFFNQDSGDIYIAAALSGRHPLTREADAKVGEVDCYVVSCVFGSPDSQKPGTASSTVWIGKTDFLIHQSRTRYLVKGDSSAPPGDEAIDDAIKKALEMQHKPVTLEAIAAMRPQMRAIMKQVQGTLQLAYASGGVVYTQVRENIAMNEKLSPHDFDH